MASGDRKPRGQSDLVSDYMRRHADAARRHGAMMPSVADGMEDLSYYVDAVPEPPDQSSETDGFSLTEATALAVLAYGVGDLSLRLFGQAYQPRRAMFGAIPALRRIAALTGPHDLPSATVMEIGASNAYLAPLLLGQGYRYIGCDPDPGRYLWRGQLLRYFLGTDFHDAAPMDEDATIASTARAVHLPWWSLWGSEIFLIADLVVINDQVIDLPHPWLDRILDTARAALKRSALGILVCDSVLRETPPGFFERFHRRRLHPVACDSTMIHAPAEAPSLEWQYAHLETPHAPLRRDPGDALPRPDWAQDLFRADDILPPTAVARYDTRTQLETEREGAGA